MQMVKPKDVVLWVRLDPALGKFIDRLVVSEQKLSPDHTVTRSGVVREIIRQAALDSLLVRQ